MKRLFTLICAAFLTLAAFAVDTSYSFVTALPSGWTASVAPYGFETSSPTRGAQFTSSSNLTLKGLSGVTQVTITCSSNVSDLNSIAVSVGSTSFGTKTLTKNNHTVLTYSGTSSNGDLVIAITRKDKSVYIEKVVITSGVAPTTPSDTTSVTPGDTLDPEYDYPEPTIVANTDSIGNNIAYSFIQNNILVECTKGARTGSTFSCNAGYSITFTAAIPLTGLIINGSLKQGFSATASAGEIAYLDASDEAVEADTVLVVSDIDSTSVTLSCAKQLRIYSISFFFDTYPDIEFGDDDDDDVTYSYEWEPTEKTTLDLVFDEISTGDMTDNLGYACSYIDLANDDYEMELTVFAALEASGLPAVGTYPINSTYTANTVMASPGGDDEMDYPSYLLTGFYQEDGDWYYTYVYYLVGGTLEIATAEGGTQLRLNATSYNGSTIKTTYLVEGTALENIASNNKARKSIENGHVVIRQNGEKYSVLGTKL